MASVVMDFTTRRPGAHRPLVRTLWLGFLLLAELGWLTIRFDVASVGSGGWAEVFRLARFVPGFGIAFLAAVAIVAGPALPRIAADFLGRTEDHPGRWLWLGCHLTAFAGLVRLSYAVFEGGLDETSLRARIAGWSVLAGACLLAWVGAVAPPRAWSDLIRKNPAPILAGVGIGLAAMLAGNVTLGFWGPLADTTFSVVEGLLGCIYSEVWTDRTARAIGTSRFRVSISDQCSGYEGIGLITAFLAAFFWTFRSRLRFPQAWLLWPLGISGIWLLNAFRIAALIVIGVEYSPEVAVGGFHSQAGWILFNGVSLGLMYVALRSPFFATTALSRGPDAAVDSLPARSTLGPVATHLAPLFALVAMNMLVVALSGGFEWLYPAKVLVTGFALWKCRRAWLAGRWSWSWRAFADGLFVFAFWLVLARFGETRPNAPPGDLTGLPPLWRAAWLAFRVAGAVLTVPLAEELAFRGYLLRRCSSADFETVSYRQAPWWGVILSSALFGLMHGLWIAGCVAGLWYAISARRRDSLSDAVLAHATTNALIAAAVLLGDQWWLW